MQYYTLEELKKMDKSDIVYVRTTVLYAHKVRIQQNSTQTKAFNIVKRTIDGAQDKKHIDYRFAKMTVADVLFVFEKYFKDYRNLVLKCSKESILE